MRINGYSTESIDEGLEFDRDGLRITPSVNWRVNQMLSVNGGIRYRSNESLTTTGEREGVMAFVGFDYRFKPTTFSR